MTPTMVFESKAIQTVITLEPQNHIAKNSKYLTW